jgi:hypothetical protein
MPDHADRRTISLGLRGVTLARRRRLLDRFRGSRPMRNSQSTVWHENRPSVETMPVDGLVYVAELTPQTADSTDWMEMLSAFCWVFRDDPNVTLVIQAPEFPMTGFLSTVMFNLYRIGPVKCSIIVASPSDMAAVGTSLQENATFFVQADGEQPDRMTMHRYLSAGTPVIACVDEDEALRYKGAVLHATPLRRPERVSGHRRNVSIKLKPEIDWDAFRAAFEESCRLTRREVARYTELRKTAAEWGTRST